MEQSGFADGSLRKFTRTSMALIGTVMAAVLLTSQPAHAATIVVNTNDDIVADDGQCSLREAIISANTDTASGLTSGECSVGIGVDVITVSVAGPITLTAGELALSSDIILNGGGVTIDANSASRVLNITGSNVVLDSLIITGGDAVDGAGILNDGSLLAITNSQIIGNEAADSGGGISTVAGATTSLTDTIVSANHALTGGGLATAGTLNLTDSVVSGNHADTDGGGIVALVGGSITISGSTIADNVANFASGGGDGGGLFNGQAVTAISESTISGNSADVGGGIANGDSSLGTITLSNSTISGNTATVGGALFNENIATVVFSTITNNTALQTGGGSGIGSKDNAVSTTVGGSIVAGNVGDGGDLEVIGLIDTFVSDGFNVIGDGSGAAEFISSGDTIIGSASPGLEVLADNGGATKTHAVLVGSAAVDLVTSTLAGDVSVDQTGAIRPQGLAKDAGAFEGLGGTAVAAPDADVITALAPKAIDVLANDTVDVATLVLVTVAPTQGVALVNLDMTITYYPGAGSTPSDSFEYMVCSGVVCDSALVTLVIVPPTCNDLPATIWGSDAAELIIGTPGIDVIVGLGGVDIINGFDGDDVICGGNGNDTINAGPGADTIFGQAGSDLLNGSTGDDTIDGGEGIDRIYGHAGNDILIGGDGGDRMYGGTENDTMTGGVGDDRMYGQAGLDTLDGESGADLILGGLDDDIVTGGADNDVLHGQGGVDTLNGDGGMDTLYGGTDGDTLNGGSESDQLFGHAGADTLNGGSEDDLLHGGTDNDTLNGGDDNDSLFGQAGDDALFGDAGTQDFCHGGIGSSDSADVSCESSAQIP